MSAITDKKSRRGQALLLVVVMMGGVLFLVTAVAGLLMYYQVEHANDAANSTVAIFAADAGLERGLYYYFYEYDPSSCDPVAECTKETPVIPPVVFTNGASASTTIVIPPQSALGEPVSVSANGMDAGGRTIRSLETNFYIGL
ncbi:MAG: hypothetical protein V1885_00800 [Candidatus Brennerbacteria bacterium]